MREDCSLGGARRPQGWEVGVKVRVGGKGENRGCGDCKPGSGCCVKVGGGVGSRMHVGRTGVVGLRLGGWEMG